MLRYDPFKPFGKNVRIGIVGHATGDQELAANLSDLCALHNVDYKEASQLEYPNGSIAMLNPKAQGIGGDLYLTELAYGVFMAWVGGCHE